ncbi:hypothetical protein DESUT3_23670 [Desulfuromonas versatilis]|uniref:Chromosomal replication initiator DnaA C-terminal domain-containing protein n=1 Tax=Desulfuromonas versatilis TaxID=2802975 RepID=A0ABM8HTP9_9BACT|nr:hypothetical protein DESUT3_23670 [Desulfuromonas versatilis]
MTIGYWAGGPVGNTDDDLEKLLTKVTESFQVDRIALTQPDRYRNLARARAVLCHLAMRYSGVKGTELAKHLSMTQAGVSVAADRGAP